jgi:hypothetical protein
MRAISEHLDPHIDAPVANDPGALYRQRVYLGVVGKKAGSLERVE